MLLLENLMSLAAKNAFEMTGIDPGDWGHNQCIHAVSFNRLFLGFLS